MTTITLTAEQFKALHACAGDVSRVLDRIWIGPRYAITSDGTLLLRVEHGADALLDAEPVAVEAVKPFGKANEGDYQIDLEAGTVTRERSDTIKRVSVDPANIMPDVVRIVDGLSTEPAPLGTGIGWGAAVLERVGKVAALLGAGGVQLETHGTAAATVRMPGLKPEPLLVAMPCRLNTRTD